MKYTQNYNLRKPEDTDPADIQDLNNNADAIDGKLKEIEDRESAHLQASNPHSITPALIGAETPTGAQQRANQAETNAKSYADQVASDLSQKLNETRIKVLDVEQDVSNISKVLTNLNPNQEAKQTVSGIGMVSLPKNAANGQVSVSVKGETVTNIVPDSSCEVLGQGLIDANGSIISIETTDKLFGASSKKITSTAKVNSAYINKPIDATKYWFGTAFVKNITSPAVAIRFRREKTGEILKTGQVHSGTNWARIGVKISPNEIAENPDVNLNLRFDTSDQGQTTLIDGIMLNEISAEDFSLTEQELMQKYPYISSGTKSTVGAMRLKSVGKNLFDESKLESVNNNPNLVWDGKVLSTYGYANSLRYDHPFVKYVRSLLKAGHTYTSTRTVERLSGDVGAFGSVQFYNDTYGPFEVFAYGNGDREKTFTVPEDFFEKWGTSQLIIYGTLNGTGERVRISRFQIEESSTATPYEPYKESNAYVVAKDSEGKIAELRSLPNGVKDEVNVTTGVKTQRIGIKENVASGTVINYADMATDGQFVAYFADGTSQTGVKGDTLTALATTLTYQLATPIEIPIQTSGSLVSYPSGTVYIEPFVADAGIYTDKMEVLYSDLPIKALEKISKVDFATGLETELDVSAAVIAEDKLSFTHPDLVAGDIVFFTYEYDRESTVGETEISYYDSRYVIKGEDGKFYQWEIEAKLVEDVITPSIKLVEV